MKYLKIALFITLAITSNTTLASFNISYNDIRRIQRPISYSTPSNKNIIELNTGEDIINYEGILKINSNFLSYNTDLPKVTPEGFDWTSGGLFPIFNSYIKVKKQFSNRLEFNSFKHRIPTEAQDLEEWKIGDAIYYNVVGGLGLFLTTGIDLIGLGPKAYVEGGFSVYIEKKSNTIVFVEVQKAFTKSISLLAGTWGIFAEKSLLNQATNGLNFSIDLSTKSGIEAYEKIVNSGDAAFAQKNTEGVIKTGLVSSKTNTNTNKVAIVTPFIPFIELLSQRQVQYYDEHRENIWDQESDTKLVLHKKENSYRLFGAKGFFTRKLNLTLDNDKISNGSYEIFKEKNHFKTNTLKRAIKKLYSYTDQDFFKNKELAFDKEKLKYANVRAKITFSNEILNKFNKFMGEDNLKKSVRAFKKYFKKSGFDKLLKKIEVCGGSIELAIEGETITRHILKKSYNYTKECTL